MMLPVSLSHLFAANRLIKTLLYKVYLYKWLGKDKYATICLRKVSFREETIVIRIAAWEKFAAICYGLFESLKVLGHFLYGF